MLKKSQAELQNFTVATQHEWLETNGLGAWSGSSVPGANTRRYHGLLVAATEPPANRMVLLSKLDETIIVGDKRTELGCNLYPGNTIHPTGHLHLSGFCKDLFPEWIYEAEGVRLKKTITMAQGENCTLVLYEVLEASQPFILELLPLVAARDYHSLQQEGSQIHWDAEFSNDIFHCKPDGNIDLFIKVPGASYLHTPRWFNRFHYIVEQYRGLDFEEDLFNHGVFKVSLKKNDRLGVIISTQDPIGKDAFTLFEGELIRKNELLKHQPHDEMLNQLVLAADQFIVKRGDDLKTIIAGYHWFTDWGRDTMISLPGLTLSTGRLDDARKILSAFARSVSMGMLPNRFQEKEPPEYNNVDGTLWYFNAVYKFLQASGDKKYILNDILPVLKEIVNWHFKGTRYNIHVDYDGLLFAGEKGQQLTWMDARIGDWVVTPRMGKPVEIQALWYNALMIYSSLLQLNREIDLAKKIKEKAQQTKDAFNKVFWNNEGAFLFDGIDENGNPDSTLRPNQLFAISLDFAILDDEKKAKAILNVVEKELYTPVGLRSLSVSSPNYIPFYGGNVSHRDSSYHQGTVWSWLLGAYLDALVKIKGETGKKQAQEVINNFRYHLNEAGIGSVSEIFDAEVPHHPRGCVAQAWGVAEILRSMTEYELYSH
jgi:predicted glycogen debranching enzyme